MVIIEFSVHDAFLELFCETITLLYLCNKYRKVNIPQDMLMLYLTFNFVSYIRLLNMINKFIYTMTIFKMIFFSKNNN
jgi:hypothetical protein